MKAHIKYFLLIILFLLKVKISLANETIKIGLLAPFSGEFEYIGKSVIGSTKMALEKIDNNNIYILPRDTKADNLETIKKVEELYVEGVRIFIGPVFNKCLNGLEKYQDAIFLSLTNKILNNPKNVIAAGINAISQIKTIIKFQKLSNLERSIFLIPDSSFKKEIKEAIKNTNIQLKDIFIYDTDPTLLTAQIEKLTRYPQRKQRLEDEIQRLKESEEINKETKISNLEKKDTLGGINFDSVIIADFDESLKSVTTSLLYTDVSSKRVHYICMNQWFDESLLKEKSLQPIYFPSVNKENYEEYINEYINTFKKYPNQISFLSYDIIGLVYFLLFQNDFEVDKKIFYKKNKFKGKIGFFEIKENKISHILNVYKVEDNNFKKIF